LILQRKPRSIFELRKKN